MSLRTRIRILARDGHRCGYCGRSSRETVLEVDHKVPLAKGGTNDPGNLITACRDCNQGKGVLELDETPAIKCDHPARSLRYHGWDSRDGRMDERYSCLACGQNVSGREAFPAFARP